LKNNSIADVELGCFIGMRLVDVNFNLNNLTDIPSLWSIKNTLEVLRVASNAITTIKPSDIEYLTKLNSIFIGFNPISHLIDFSEVLPSLQYIGLRRLSIECCWETVWLKTTSVTVLTVTTTCKAPPSLDGVLFDDVPETKLAGTPCGMYQSLQFIFVRSIMINAKATGNRFE
jgi:hypothetical protein